MTDIVEQLRDLQSGAQWVCGETAATLEDAADEIERLREEGAEAAVMSNRANNRATSLQMEVYYLKAEIERLRAECQRLAGEVSRAHKDALVWMEQAAAADADIERLRRFVQYVADYSNDPAIVKEALAHGAG